MQQTGKFHVYEIKDDKRVVSAIANATLYFLDVNNQKQFKLIAKTDNEGNFSFDLALGEYVVLATAGDGLEQILANGSTFKLTAQSKVSSFEEWLNSPSESVDSSLLAKFREIMQRTETASESIKNTEAQLRKDINKKWDKEEGTTALAKKQDELEFVGEGKVMKEGSYGIGVDASMPTGGTTHLFNGLKNGFYSEGGLNSSLAGASAYIVNNIGAKKGPRKRKVIIGLEATNNVGLMVRPNLYLGSTDDTGSFRFGWSRIWGDGNTTVDSNGFIKAASPIIRLFNDRIEINEHFAEEPIFEKLSTGTYKISNTLGLAQEGWTYEKPRGSDGQPYFRIIVEKLEDGCIVRVHDEYDTVEKAEITDIDGNTRTVDKIVKILGQARDIKEHERWIDLRFHEEPEEHHEEPEEYQEVEEG